MPSHNSAPDLSAFVDETFRAMDAELTDLAPGSGVWSAKVQDHEARFLGRSGQDQILYTFDLNRWDDGSKLECLTEVSPLVRRLQDYAITKGSTLVAHVPVQARGGYQTYLLARFAAHFKSFTSFERVQWLGVNLLSGAALNVKGDPMLTPGLVEGMPPGLTLNEISYGRVPAALQLLTDQWNESVEQEMNRQQQQNQRSFTAQAQDIYEAVSGRARGNAIAQLRRQFELTVECELTMALVLSLPRA